MRKAAWALALFLLLAGNAWAHRMNLFALAEGTVIKGTATFGGGGGGAGLTIRFSGPDGAPLGTATTALDGSFTFPIARRMDHLLAVESMDGHAASFVVKAEEIAESLPAGSDLRIPPGNAELEAAVARQIAPLRAQIAAYEERVRLHDILGGIGYIVGLAGLAFFLLGRKPRP